MLRARHLIPLIIPVLLIGIPSIAYVIDSRSGAIPTQAQWESAAHSSGPWMSSWVFDACALLGFGGIIITGSEQRSPRPPSEIQSHGRFRGSVSSLRVQWCFIFMVGSLSDSHQTRRCSPPLHRVQHYF